MDIVISTGIVKQNVPIPKTQLREPGSATRLSRAPETAGALAVEVLHPQNIIPWEGGGTPARDWPCRASPSFTDSLRVSNPLFTAVGNSGTPTAQSHNSGTNSGTSAAKG